MLGPTISLALALALAADPPAPQADRSRERICRGGGERTLGSHVRSRRRCLTVEQWQQEDEARARPASGLQITEGQNDGRNLPTPQ